MFRADVSGKLRRRTNFKGKPRPSLDARLWKHKTDSLTRRLFQGFVGSAGRFSGGLCL